MIYIKNDRSVFPNNVKVSNQYENETRTIQFDLSDVQFTGNTYLICKYQNNQDFYTPLLLDSNFSIPVETFLSAQAGTYSCVIAISTATIGPNYDFSTDNPLFVSNIFTLTVDANFLTGTSTAWQLTPAAQNYFDQLIALVDKVQSDLDSGAFNGNGIQSITKTGSQGLVDTYQITFTNGSTFDYQVTNGQDGQTPTITIQDGYWYINGVNTGQQAKGEKGDPGKDGTDGTDGVGIQSIQKTSTEGNVDTYTITYTNETTSTFTVTNGVTPNITIGTVTTLQPTEQATATITGTPENPVLNLGIPQGIQGEPGNVENKLIGTVGKTENPSVTDSYNTELMNLKFYGKSTQETTTGAQLFDISKFADNSQCVNNGDGSITILRYGVVLNNKISDVLPDVKVGDIIYISAINETLVYVGGKVVNINQDSPIEITESVLESDLFGFYGSNNGEITISNIMISKEYQTPYEPYTGGHPSPSPEYPQDIMAIEEVSGNVNNGIGNEQPFSFTPPQPLYSTQDGSIADVVNVDSGQYEYNLGILNFTSADIIECNYVKETTSGYNCFRFVINSKLLTNKAIDMRIMCNLFAYHKTAWVTDKVNVISADQATRNTFYAVVESNISTVEDFKALFYDGAQIIYVLQTPTTQPIPAETLAILRALKSNTGVTNVICNAPVSFDYEQSLQIVIQNIWNAIGQTNANILLGGVNNV